jgi:outer membrane lipoprotein carrier protein
VAIANRAARTYQQLVAFGADFQQLIEDSMIGNYESRGRLIQAGTARLSMRFSDPKGDAIVMDGRKLWVYTPSTTPGQVIRMGIPSGPKFGFSVLAWLLDRPAERYHISYLRPDQADGQAVDVIQLDPLEADLPFDRAVLWLDTAKALPRRLEIRERRGTYRTLIFSHIQANPDLKPDTFRFDVPSGVRIVDQ